MATVAGLGRWYRRAGALLCRPRRVRRPGPGTRGCPSGIQVSAQRPGRSQPERVGPVRPAAQRRADRSRVVHRRCAIGRAGSLRDAQPDLQAAQLRLMPTAAARASA